MALTTFSKFYYGHVIDENNKNLDFNEGAEDLLAELRVGSYSLSDFCIEIARAMSAVGAQDYKTTIDRSTRQITIFANDTFSLLVSSGTGSGNAPYGLAGFTGSDRTTANSYLGDTASGSVFCPQKWLQAYVPFEHGEDLGDASINDSVNVTEIVTFGVNRYCEMNITPITNILQGSNGQLRANPTGLDEFLDFKSHLIRKRSIEFMPDENDADTYFKCVLQSSPGSKNATKLPLKKIKGLVDYFESGKLIFKELT